MTYVFLRGAQMDHEQWKLRLLTDERCKNVLLDLLKEAHKKAKGNACAPIVEVLERVALKPFYTGGAEELLDDKM